MKKMLVNLALLLVVSSAFAMPPVSEQVMKQFTALFPTVQDARWFENETHYDVYFDKDDVKHHIRYDRNGKIISTRNYYPGSKLCSFIKAKATEKYPTKSIYGVTEITSNEEMYYVVILEDEDSWTNVQIDATGQMKVLDKMKKAK
jgi:hypothetical protein